MAINLASVSCTGSGSCVAAGDMDVNGNDEGLAYVAAEWTGRDWLVYPSPNP